MSRFSIPLLKNITVGILLNNLYLSCQLVFDIERLKIPSTIVDTVTEEMCIDRLFFSNTCFNFLFHLIFDYFSLRCLGIVEISHNEHQEKTNEEEREENTIETTTTTKHGDDL